jgi:hypothetical protein
MLGENDLFIYDYQMYDYDDYWYDYDPGNYSISMGELVVPLLVYSITFTIGLMGNTLILVAVKAKKQVRRIQSVIRNFWSTSNMGVEYI